MVSTTPCIWSTRVEAAAHPLDRPQQLAQSLEREELALQWNQHRVRRGQALIVSTPSEGGQSIRMWS